MKAIIYTCTMVLVNALCLGFALAAPTERVLFPADQPLDPAKLTPKDARITLAGEGGKSVLRVATGHEERWPGITLPAPNGAWDLTPFAHVSVLVKNIGTNPVTVFCRVDNPGADGVRNCLTGSLSLSPQSTGELRVNFKRTRDDTLNGKLFGLRGYPVAAVATGGTGAIDPARINQLLLFVSDPKANHAFEVSAIRASGAYTPPTAWTSDADPFFPLIDTFGQYRHKDWPGKTHSVAELRQRREAEAKTLAAGGPADWNQFGGWAAGPQLKATGFFRVEKHQGKWWLVDPEGRLFFSHGIDCVRMIDTTPIEGRTDWFENFPGNQPEFTEFLSSSYALHGHYANKNPKCFSFAGANLKRKYGPEWREENARVIHPRLRYWGLNTIGMWSDARVFMARKTPYVDAIGSSGAKRIEGSEGYWGQFPDVFDPSFKQQLERAMEGKRNRSAGDPWCLGYFCDNELAWGDDTSLAIAALRSPTNQAIKQVFVDDLKSKYGTIEQLNAAWGTGHASWQALAESRQVPDKKRAEADLLAFYSRIAEQYFRTIRETIKAKAPSQLFLGCRFAWVNARAAAAAAKYCDIVSYNLYQRSVADFQFNGGADVPLIIGEFHFGALDRGMFHTGLVSTANQDDRANHYREYVQGALRHPNFVGCHWFQYQDEPTTGRVYDEENYQIGFIDIADTPYAEIIAASSEIGRTMYRLRLPAANNP